MVMLRLLSRIVKFLKALLVVIFYWGLSRSWCIRHLRRPGVIDDPEPKIYGHWHGDELTLIGAHVGSGMAILVSRSRDGELLHAVMRLFGFRVLRGSSHRGGVGGLKGLLDVVQKEKRSASLAVDGPRGPIYRVKPGIIKLAQQTQCSLIVGAAAAKRRFVFKRAWNRCYLPLPFTKCVIAYGEPMKIPARLTEEEFENYRLRVENVLFALKAEAEAYFKREFEVAILQPKTLGA